MTDISRPMYQDFCETRIWSGDRVKHVGKWFVDYTIERHQFMRVLGTIMSEQAKAKKVGAVRVLKLLVDPDLLLMHARDSLHFALLENTSTLIFRLMQMRTFDNDYLGGKHTD